MSNVHGPEPSETNPTQVISGIRKRLANIGTIKGFLTRLAFLVVVLWVIFGVVFGICPMGSGEMSPRIEAGDLMLYYRLDGAFSEGDVVVYNGADGECTARVVAVPGDVVEITEESTLNVNGSLVVENNIFYQTPRYSSSVSYPVQLGQDEYFLLADYREGGRDSRMYGAVKRADIKGKVITVVRRSNL